MLLESISLLISSNYYSLLCFIWALLHSSWPAHGRRFLDSYSVVLSFSPSDIFYFYLMMASSVMSDLYYFGRGPKPFFSSPVNKNTEPLSENSMSLVWQPEIDRFSLATSISLGPVLLWPLSQRISNNTNTSKLITTFILMIKENSKQWK